MYKPNPAMSRVSSARFGTAVFTVFHRDRADISIWTASGRSLASFQYNWTVDATMTPESCVVERHQPLDSFREHRASRRARSSYRLIREAVR
jgi:hypothetical protein